MMFSLLVGIVVGAVAVIFALQNVATVTVTFLLWQITAPLALILLGTMLSGIVLALLLLLPSVIRDEMYISTVKKQKREAEDELARMRVSPPVEQTQTTQTNTTTVV